MADHIRSRGRDRLAWLCPASFAEDTVRHRCDPDPWHFMGVLAFTDVLLSRHIYSNGHHGFPHVGFVIALRGNDLYLALQQHKWKLVDCHHFPCRVQLADSQ